MVEQWTTDHVLSHLPAPMYEGLALLPALEQPLILLTRHSIRERASGLGLAGYDLPLTPMGRELACVWGNYLTQQTQRVVTACVSSPIQRCVDTAELMLIHQREQHPIPEIVQTTLLVEPGSFVVDIRQAGPLFRQHGPLNFINAFLDDQLPGMKIPHQGVLDILKLLFHHQPTTAQSLLLAVSHDTILAALLAVMAGHRQITWADWPEMMEGVFLWFEGAVFEQALLHWVWRGQHYQQPIYLFADRPDPSLELFF
jgi:broad specificity phosphatase PhoE